MSSPQKTPAHLEELRARIEDGRYEVKADRVADAMIRAGVIPPAADRRERRG